MDNAILDGMESAMFITINDYQKLTGLIELGSSKVKMPEIVNRLHDGLKGAKMLPQEKISNRVVTMNSRVLLKEVSNGRAAEITITYPQDADNLQKKVSVLSPIGVALLGRQTGDIVSWKVPNGIGEFEIAEITYQPEAVGHYYL